VRNLSDVKAFQDFYGESARFKSNLKGRLVDRWNYCVNWWMRLDSRWTRSLGKMTLLLALLYLISAGALRAQVPTDEFHGDCLLCHETDSQTDGSLILPEPEVCLLCHSPNNDHAILVQPTTVDPSLPLTNGLMTCITCHDQHSPQSLQLRMPATQLCASCHDL
jgi:predicted CXXCH cytochrome family protein